MNCDKIKFTSGIVEKITFDYYNVTLFNGTKQVYIGIIERLDAAELIHKYYPNKITLVS